MFLHPFYKRPKFIPKITTEKELEFHQPLFDFIEKFSYKELNIVDKETLMNLVLRINEKFKI
jgi:hypothetical protein